jgi:Zn-dependent protease with chaperone function
MIAGRWFDGRSSRARTVRVDVRPGRGGPRLWLHPADEAGGAPIEFASSQVGWPQAWSAGRAPRTVVVDLRERGSLEIDAVDQWLAACEAAGERPPLAQRMQTRLPVFLGVLLVAAVALWAFYRWGTPWAATQLTREVPLAWETSLADNGLKDLDASFLQPSKLPPERQAALRQRFADLAARLDPSLARYPGYSPRLQLQLRSGLGANAFALPGGTVVMTDAIVLAAQRDGQSDDALAGVLAHEIGHVVHRHTTRLLVEQAVLNVGLGLALGDVSTVLSMGSSLLTGLAYRRGHESEADCFAATLMGRAGLPTAPMADLLLGLQGRRDRDPAATEGARALAGLLDSHPVTAERAGRLRQGAAAACKA